LLERELPKFGNWGVLKNKLSESANGGLNMGCQYASLFYLSVLRSRRLSENSNFVQNRGMPEKITAGI